MAGLIAGVAYGDSITTGDLIDDSVDLDRLARMPEPAYKTLQF